MDADILEIYLPVIVSSLFGQIGSASILYQIHEYSRNMNTNTLKIKTANRESVKKLW